MEFSIYGNRQKYDCRQGKGRAQPEGERLVLEDDFFRPWPRKLHGSE